jgi:hypothetical protein
VNKRKALKACFKSKFLTVCDFFIQTAENKPVEEIKQHNQSTENNNGRKWYRICADDFEL